MGIQAREGETLDLHLLGRSALILGYKVQLMTRDVAWTSPWCTSLAQGCSISPSRSLGEGSGRQAHHFYLETVSTGLPSLPPGYQTRCIDIPGRWQTIRPKRPEVHDLVVSKLKRFHQGDREDIRILCDTGEVEAGRLQERAELAYTFSDRDDPKVISAFEHLRIVLDYLGGRRKGI